MSAVMDAAAVEPLRLSIWRSTLCMNRNRNEVEKLLNFSIFAAIIYVHTEEFIVELARVCFYSALVRRNQLEKPGSESLSQNSR